MQERVKSQLITFNLSRCRLCPPKGWSEMCGEAERRQAGKSNSLNALISPSNLLRKLREGLFPLFSYFLFLEDRAESCLKYVVISRNFTDTENNITDDKTKLNADKIKFCK